MTDTDPEPSALFYRDSKSPAFTVQTIRYRSPDYVIVNATAFHAPTGNTMTVEYVVPINRAPRVGEKVFLVAP